MDAPSGLPPFEPERLLAEPRYPVLARAAVRAVEGGSVGPLLAELGDATTGSQTLAAFAASTQGLSALLARARDVHTLPPLLASFLAGQAESAAARARVLRERLVETVALLRAAGVEIVALKGAVLAFRDYSEASLRPMGDLDLLLEDPSAMERASAALTGGGRWRPLYDTYRHRVFGAEGERVARPATEDPENPVRLELHTSFRLPVLGRWFDASAEVRSKTETLTLDGVAVTVPARPATLRHLLVHAAEDFAGLGLRGIQAHDFRLLSCRHGPLAVPITREDRSAGVAPLAYAASAVEGLFPRSFDPRFLGDLAATVPAPLRLRAAALPPLRYTRPRRGWSRTLLSLIESPSRRGRFLARTLFPSPGEVRANAAADGSSLWAAYGRLAASRLGVLVRGE